MNSKKYKELIEKHIDGVLNDAEIMELKSHAEKCSDCRGELQEATKIHSIIAEGLSLPMNSAKARDAILAKIASTQMGVISEQKSLSYIRRWIAAAAAVLVVAGFWAGFEVGKNASSIMGAKVPLNIGKVDGIVLVKHQGADSWQELKPESSVYLGDVFHCAAKSSCVLVFGDKSTMEVSQNSILELKSYNGQTEFYLKTGGLAADLISPHGPFFISTPNGRVEALGTVFKVSVE